MARCFGEALYSFNTMFNQNDLIMKKGIFTVAAIVAGLTFVTAQNIAPAPEGATPAAVQAVEKVKIKPEQLPEAVKTTLKGDDYKGWTAYTAYHDTVKNMYEVELRKGSETKSVKFDADGKKVD